MKQTKIVYMSEKEVAYHEAGHLVAQIHFGLNPIKATIIPKFELAGNVLSSPIGYSNYYSTEKSFYRFAENYVISKLAGNAAEIKINPSADWESSTTDLADATQMVKDAYNLPKKYFRKDIDFGFLQYTIARFMPKADRFVEEYWDEISFTAKLLRNKKTLWRKDIEELERTLKVKFLTFGNVAA